ncbi:MAG: acyl carrier protein [Clostridia bacterium]|nr:acyl carrier protein [Clostridia bacterium]
MLSEVIEIICEYVEADPETITPESSLRSDIGATSFDLMNIAEAVEQRWDISVPNDRLPEIYTVGDILDLLNK